MEKPRTISQGIQASCSQAQDRLARIARNRGLSVSGISEAMGYSVGYLSNSADLRLGRILEALAVAGAPPRSFFEGLFVARVDPREELALERGNPPRVSHPFLSSVEESLADWTTREIDASLPAPSHRREIDRLEDLRFYRHAEARAGFEALIGELISSAPRGSGARSSPVALAEIATALTGWAAIQRMKGQPDIGGDALALAFTLARRSGDFWALGNCYKRGAPLMREYGRPDLGLHWVDEAAHSYLLAGDMVEQIQLTCERGNMLFELADYAGAAQTYKAALVRLPAGSFRYIAAAHQGLARIARVAGDSTAELRHLNCALAAFPSPDYLYGHSLWGVGLVEIEAGADASGQSKLREALVLLQSHGSYFDVAGISLDIAVQVLKKGGAHLASLADSLRPWLKGVRRERLLRELFDDLLALIEMGDLDSVAVAELRERLAKAATYARKNSR